MWRKVMIETDRWPKIQAKWYQPMPTGERRRVRLVVVHDMEFHERFDTAEIIAKDFAKRPATNKGSAHVCIDNDTIIQCVSDNDIAYAAPGANNDGIQVELAGYMGQTRGEWLDRYGVAMLELAGNCIGQYCLKYSLPPVHLTDESLRAGGRGIVGHDQVTRVYKRSTHRDPGVNFPWDVLMESVTRNFHERYAALGDK
jgi:N-acetyl-anhydromuramyl-L-alanine amidase AmpD